MFNDNIISIKSIRLTRITQVASSQVASKCINVLYQLIVETKNFVQQFSIRTLNTIMIKLLKIL